MNNELALVKASHTRCSGSDLTGHFYEIFLKSNPRIAPMFANTDFSKQKHLLKHGVLLSIMFAEGNMLGKNGIKRIRDSHCKNKMNVRPELYKYWKASFIQAVSEIDRDFNEQTKNAWDAVLQYTIDYITEGYDVS